MFSGGAQKGLLGLLLDSFLCLSYLLRLGRCLVGPSNWFVACWFEETLRSPLSGAFGRPRFREASTFPARLTGAGPPITALGSKNGGR